MKNLILMTAISFALFMARGITGPINSLYVESLGANYTIIGILGTVTSLTAILSSYLWGWIADRLERRKILLLIGLLILAICFALLSLAPSFHYLFPINILSAIAQAAYSVASLAL
ncbi:MAG: MFS transporter, partial [Anaerolineae bacterium]|nr:MFS transporter [Anaerolineae bacterium]